VEVGADARVSARKKKKRTSLGQSNEKTKRDGAAGGRGKSGSSQIAQGGTGGAGRKGGGPSGPRNRTTTFNIKGGTILTFGSLSWGGKASWGAAFAGFRGRRAGRLPHCGEGDHLESLRPEKIGERFLRGGEHGRIPIS